MTRTRKITLAACIGLAGWGVGARIAYPPTLPAVQTTCTSSNATFDLDNGVPLSIGGVDSHGPHNATYGPITCQP